MRAARALAAAINTDARRTCACRCLPGCCALTSSSSPAPAPRGRSRSCRGRRRAHRPQSRRSGPGRSSRPRRPARPPSWPTRSPSSLSAIPITRSRYMSARRSGSGPGSCRGYSPRPPRCGRSRLARWCCCPTCSPTTPFRSRSGWRGWPPFVGGRLVSRLTDRPFLRAALRRLLIGSAQQRTHRSYARWGWQAWGGTGMVRGHWRPSDAPARPMWRHQAGPGSRGIGPGPACHAPGDPSIDE